MRTTIKLVNSQINIVFPVNLFIYLKYLIRKKKLNIPHLYSDGPGIKKNKIAILWALKCILLIQM